MAHNLGAIGAANLSAGLGAGLQALTSHKMEEIKQQKLRNSLQNLPKEAQDFIMYTAQYDPKNFHKLIPLLQGIPMQGGQQQENSMQGMQGLGQQQAQPESGLGMLQGEQQQPMQQSAAQQPMAPKNIFGQSISAGGGINSEALQKRMDKLRPELQYLEDLESTSNELKKLINDQKDPVQFGLKSSILSNLPILGDQFLSPNTGAFDSFANKFHTDATEKAKGVRSKYHLQILKKSKPSLEKTKEQNEQLLNIWDRQIAEKKARFLKDHPEFNQEVAQINAQPLNNIASNKKSPEIKRMKNGDLYLDGVLIAKKKGK